MVLCTVVWPYMMALWTMVFQMMILRKTVWL